jgi:hypothetical protein
MVGEVTAYGEIGGGRAGVTYPSGMRMALRLLRSQWPPWVETPLRRFVWDDPCVIARPDATPEEFRNAMKAIHVGGTYKITGTFRHAAADDLLLEHVNLSGADIVDVGASDASTSVDLIRRLPHDFGSYVIADLYLVVHSVRVGGCTVFHDAQDACILVVGKRFLGWPQMSALARLTYRRVIRQAERSRADRRELVLLNPEARQLIADDPRVSCRTHNVFERWPGKPPDVIKVGNLLRRLYFSDEDICRALRSLLASLDDGGYLLVLDNPRIAGIDLRGGLYQRVGQRFEVVALTPDEPEILDLVTSPEVRLPQPA